jgi:hypothetical protein
MRGSVYVRGSPPDPRAALSGSHIEWLDRPAPMSEALERPHDRPSRQHADHRASLARREATDGRPLYLEHLLTTRAQLDLGVAASVTGDSIAAMLAPLREADTNLALEHAARSFAVAHQRGADAIPRASPAKAILSLAAS